MSDKDPQGHLHTPRGGHQSCHAHRSQNRDRTMGPHRSHSYHASNGSQTRQTRSRTPVPRFCCACRAEERKRSLQRERLKKLERKGKQLNTVTSQINTELAGPSTSMGAASIQSSFVPVRVMKYVKVDGRDVLVDVPPDHQTFKKPSVISKIFRVEYKPDSRAEPNTPHSVIPANTTVREITPPGNNVVLLLPVVVPETPLMEYPEPSSSAEELFPYDSYYDVLNSFEVESEVAVANDDIIEDLFVTPRGVVDAGRIDEDLMTCLVKGCCKLGPLNGLDNHYMAAHANKSYLTRGPVERFLNACHKYNNEMK